VCIAQGRLRVRGGMKGEWEREERIETEREREREILRSFL
jgi:hypothetical protein